MRLAEFIRANPDEIESAWENFARDLLPSGHLSEWTLRDHLRAILTAMADDMETEQSANSEGQGPKGGRLNRISEVHTRERLTLGFNLENVISEYRALRSSILFLWVRNGPQADDIRLSEVTRFNETIDHAVAQVIRSHSDTDQMFNDRFVGALGHEIRNPLNTIKLLAEQLRQSPLDELQRRSLFRVEKNVESINRMVDDLSILIRSRMRARLPLSKEKTDLGVICEDVLEVIKASDASAVFKTEKIGDLTGTWDKLRLEQMIFNLASNAITHSVDKQASIVVREASADVVLTISNRGRPISEADRQVIFEPFVHKSGASPAHPSSGLGLGLFVVRQIVQAHNGSVELESKESEGTTFTVRLPRVSAD